MRICITAEDDHTYNPEIGASYLSYDPQRHRFLMAAGGYDIGYPTLPPSTRVTKTKNTIHVKFQTTRDAVEFFDWIRDATKRTMESFTTMMD
jgi:hypothetical protein